MMSESHPHLAVKCRSCFEPLYAPDRCGHRQRYLDALGYVTSKGIKINQPDYEWWAWKAARSGKTGFDRYIEISSVGFTLYGWDVMTSVLIHEFGHCDLFNEGISEGSTWDEAVQIEITANQRGLELMPSHLVPEDYMRHREFFLKAYLDEGWTEAKCRSEWDLYASFLWK
jgi:hypothetical protein